MLSRRDVLRLVPASALLPAMARGQDDAEQDDAEYVKIDTHLHFFEDAPEVVASLKESGWRGLNIAVCPAVGDEPFDLEGVLDATRKVATESDGALAWASTFDARDVEAPDFVERTIAGLRRTFDDGAIAVKIWKTVGMAIRSGSGAYLLPDDPVLLPIYEAIRDADRTLVAHLAEPDGAWLPLDERNPEFRYYSRNPQWHMLGQEGAPPKEAILAARDRVLARYPDLRVIGCHLGSNEDDLDQLAERLDAHPNLAVDTAARVRYFVGGDRDQVTDFLTRYQDRVVYGTDFAYRGGAEQEAIRTLDERHRRDWAYFADDGPMDYDGRPTVGLGLPEPILRKIFRENALRWLPGLDA